MRWSKSLYAEGVPCRRVVIVHTHTHSALSHILRHTRPGGPDPGAHVTYTCNYTHSFCYSHTHTHTHMLKRVCTHSTQIPTHAHMHANTHRLTCPLKAIHSHSHMCLDTQPPPSACTQSGTPPPRHPQSCPLGHTQHRTFLKAES